MYDRLCIQSLQKGMKMCNVYFHNSFTCTILFFKLTVDGKIGSISNSTARRDGKKESHLKAKGLFDSILVNYMREVYVW
jgi:hypothetical protein